MSVQSSKTARADSLRTARGINAWPGGPPETEDWEVQSVSSTTTTARIVRASPTEVTRSNPRLPDAAGGVGAADDSSPATTVLVASPSRQIVRSLTAGLLDLGIGRVLQVGSVERADEVIAGSVVGDLALVSVTFGPPVVRLIQGLCRIGWRRVIALIPTADPGTLAGALEAGATGVLLSGYATYAATDPPADPANVRDLSRRERDVIRLVAEGRSNRLIAQDLLLSSMTVKAHLARITRKLGAADRAQIVAIAIRAGIID